MRLYSNEFEFNMVLHEELCKREYTAMVIKTMKPDPVEFKLTVNSWLSHIFRYIKVFDTTLDDTWLSRSTTPLHTIEYFDELDTDQTHIKHHCYNCEELGMTDGSIQNHNVETCNKPGGEMQGKHFSECNQRQRQLEFFEGLDNWQEAMSKETFVTI